MTNRKKRIRTQIKFFARNSCGCSVHELRFYQIGHLSLYLSCLFETYISLDEILAEVKSMTGMTPKHEIKRLMRKSIENAKT